MNNTIVKGLRPYAWGEKFRSLRVRKSRGLVELGKHTGLLAAMLLKLKRGKLFPTLPALLRIALLFVVGLEYFFTDERKRHVVAIARKKERLRFPDSPGGGTQRLVVHCAATESVIATINCLRFLSHPRCAINLSVPRGNAMSQPNKQSGRKLRSHSVRATDLDKLLDAFRALDRTVVEISMNVYKVPRRDRATMLEQHRRLHDMVRERLPRILYQPEGDPNC